MRVSVHNAKLGRLGCLVDRCLQRSNGSPNVLPAHPQAPCQHRIGRVRQIANSCARLLVFNVDREQRHRAREASDQCRDL